MANRAAKLYGGDAMAELSEWVSVAEAARLTGLSVRTIKRMAAEGQVKYRHSPGGHMRVLGKDLERLLRHDRPGSVRAPSVLESKREMVEAKRLELQEARTNRELRKLREEDAEDKRRRAAVSYVEELERKRVTEEAQRQVASAAEERRAREREQAKVEERREWMDQWVAWALCTVPKDLPREVELDVSQAVEETLLRHGPERSQTTTNRLVLAAVDRSLRPWRRQKQIEEVIQLSRKELPFCLQRYFEPSEWEVKAMQMAREAIRSLPNDCAFDELRQTAIRAGRQVAAAYENEQSHTWAEAQAERERLQCESNKRFLVSVGTTEASILKREQHTAQRGNRAGVGPCSASSFIGSERRPNKAANGVGRIRW